jgi:hypothetical protein
MVKSHDELLMEIARDTGLDRMGGGMKMMERKKRMPTMEQMPPHPLLLHHHFRCPLLSCLNRSTKKALWR